MSKHLDVEPIGSRIIWQEELFNPRKPEDHRDNPHKGRTIFDFSKLSPSINRQREMVFAMAVLLSVVVGKRVKIAGQAIKRASLPF